MNDGILQLFTFEGVELRVVGTADNPLWVASDVCVVLDILNTSDALKRIPDNWKDVRLVQTSYGVQAMLCVTEPGLYELIFASRKPIARKFRFWVFEEVLPLVRSAGIYNIQAKLNELLRLEKDRQNDTSVLVERHYTERFRVFMGGETKNRSFPLAKSEDLLDYIGFGIPDLVCDGFIVEVKRFSAWKHALGQILAYSYDPKKILGDEFSPAVYIFDVPSQYEIDLLFPIFSEHGVIVFYSLKESPHIISRL